MAHSDSRSVGRPPNSPGRMEPRSVPVQHDKPRINDQRKVRPHAAGTPAMGIRPSGGAQKPLKKPPLNRDYMGMRDVPVDKIHEAWPFSRSSKAPLPQHPQGDVLAWHWNRKTGEIHVVHIRDGEAIDQKLMSSPQELKQQIQTAKNDYYNAKTDSHNLRFNPKQAAMDAVKKYASEHGITPVKVGEWGRDIPAAPFRRAQAASTPSAGGDVGGSPYNINAGGGAGGSPYNINTSASTSPLSQNFQTSGSFTQNLGHNMPGYSMPGENKPTNTPGEAAPKVPGASSPEQDTGSVGQMPLPGMNSVDVDRLLTGARESGVKGYARWTPDVIRTSSELNKRQAADKLMRMNTHANNGRIGEGYPDTSFERDEPAHESRIGDLGWSGNPYEPQPPALNREYAQFRDLSVEKIHEMAEAEMTDLILRTAARLGFTDLSEEEDDDWHQKFKKDQDSDDDDDCEKQFESAIPRARYRWVGESGHGLPKPKRPLPPNIAGSGKNFHVKPGTNNAKKQPGRLAGSGKAMKVKPGFIG